MANEYSTKGLTGESTRKQVSHRSTAIQHGVVQSSHLTDKASVVNDITKSGKQDGACIMNTAGVIHIARGSADTSVWNTMAVGTQVVPA